MHRSTVTPSIWAFSFLQASIVPLSFVKKYDRIWPRGASSKLQWWNHLVNNSRRIGNSEIFVRARAYKRFIKFRRESNRSANREGWAINNCRTSARTPGKRDRHSPRDLAGRRRAPIEAAVPKVAEAIEREYVCHCRCACRRAGLIPLLRTIRERSRY